MFDWEYYEITKALSNEKDPFEALLRRRSQLFPSARAAWEMYKLFGFNHESLGQVVLNKKFREDFNKDDIVPIIKSLDVLIWKLDIKTKHRSLVEIYEAYFKLSPKEFGEKIDKFYASYNERIKRAAQSGI